MSKLRSKFKRTPALKREEVTALMAPLADLGEGERVFVTTLSSAARDAYELSRSREVPLPGGRSKHVVDFTNSRAKLVCKALVDESGERVFADDDAAWLGEEYPSDVMGQLYDIAKRLSGLDADESESAKNVGGGGADGSPTV